VIVTVSYFIWIKPHLTVATIEDAAAFAAYSSNANIMLGVYIIAVIITQTVVNLIAIAGTCGGSVTSNIGAAFLITFIPWVFIFGAIVCALIVFPGFKSAFSNVVGYFVVATSATQLLGTLLVDTQTQVAVNAAFQGQPSDEQLKLQEAQEAIVKLCGNVGIFINQIVPSNFVESWALLKPLMKSSIAGEAETKLKEKLLAITITRDNIGEALWYTYTAVLLISITQFSIATRGCTKDLAAIQNTQQHFLESQAASDADTAKAASTVYTY